jgi:hypothetical protein
MLRTSDIVPSHRFLHLFAKTVESQPDDIAQFLFVQARREFRARRGAPMTPSDWQ